MRPTSDPFRLPAPLVFRDSPLGSGGFFDTTGEQHMTQAHFDRTSKQASEKKYNIIRESISKDRSKSRPNPKARFKKKGKA